MSDGSEFYKNSEDIDQKNPNVAQPVPDRKKAVLERLKVCLIIILAYLVLNLFHIGCPIKAYTGISCPGCGMTRAVWAALLLHFDSAFYYHPLFFLTPFMFLFFLFDDFITKKVKSVFWTSIIILFFGVYFYRLIFTVNDVVTIDIQSGKVLKLLHQIIAWEGFTT